MGFIIFIVVIFLIGFIGSLLKGNDASESAGMGCGCVFLVFVGLLVLGLGIAFFNGGDDSPSSPTVERDGVSTHKTKPKPKPLTPIQKAERDLNNLRNEINSDIRKIRDLESAIGQNVATWRGLQDKIEDLEDDYRRDKAKHGRAEGEEKAELIHQLKLTMTEHKTSKGLAAQKQTELTAMRSRLADLQTKLKKKQLDAKRFEGELAALKSKAEFNRNIGRYKVDDNTDDVKQGIQQVRENVGDHVEEKEVDLSPIDLTEEEFPEELK